MTNVTEKAVKQLKAYGRYIVNNAETIVSDIDQPTWVTEGGIRIAFTLLEHENVPIIEVSHEYIVLEAIKEEKAELPCPFCTGEAETKNAHQDIDGTWHPASCGCPTCGLFFYGDISYGHNGFADSEDYDESRRQAIKRWNTRTVR